MGPPPPAHIEGVSAGGEPSQDGVDDRPAILEPPDLAGKVLDETSTAVASHLQAPRPLEVATGMMDKADTTAKAAHTIESTLKPVLEKLEVFCNVMDKVAEVHPYAKMAWTILKGVYTVVQNQLHRDQSILGLFAQMKSLYEIVYDLQKQLDDIANPGIKSPKELLQRISIQTLDCCFFVRSYGSLPFAKRMTKGIFSNVDKRITEYCAAFGSLKQEFYDKLHVNTHLVVSRVLQAVEGAGEKATLSDMPYKQGASLGDKSKQCLPGTRTGILDRMSMWANTDTSEDGKPVCANTGASEDGGSVRANTDASEDGGSVWANTDASEDGRSVWANADTGEDGPKSLFVLAGPAGTGKSAIAHSMTAHYRALRRLAASFGFKRGPKSDGLTMLFPTIAQDMADFDEDIRKALCAAVGDDKALRTTHDLERQLENFILKPLSNIVFSGPVLIVIDALDECGDSSDQEELAGLLARRAKDFPPNLRILITSRAEFIIEIFRGRDNVVIQDMGAVDSTLEDIRLYVRSRLIIEPLFNLPKIDEQCCEELAEASQGLFQWASVACAQIARRTPGLAPSDIYEELVGSARGVSRTNLLDKLYKDVLSRLFNIGNETAMDNAGNEAALDRFRSVLGMICYSFEPFSMDSLVAMCQSYCDAALVLPFLGSLLSGVTYNTSHDPVRPIHTSFRDFLLDPRRSDIFFVDSNDAHQRFTVASLRVMNKELVFNICELKSSWDRNDKVADLADRIKKHIPHHLSYSCRFWGHHLLTASSLDSQFVHPFNKFLSEKLLSWLEVMSLTTTMSFAIQIFDDLARLKSNHYFKTLEGISMDAVHDISNFLDMSQPAILDSAPHIYLSALPFVRPNSFVANKYLPKLQHTLRICNPSLADWPMWRILLPDRYSEVSDLVFTPFGTCVVATESGPYILDATSGSVIHEPPDGIDMSGGCGPVAICASEAGVQVVFAPKFGSHIHIWSPHTGYIRTVSPNSHGSILCLSFPDNTKLFAGSSNGDIYRIDLPTGEVTVLYHSNEPFSYVSFSSDGTLVAHGQTSGQAEVFDTTTHAYSADGQHICAYSRNAVHRWHLDTVVPGGHVDTVISTYISDDGRWIATRSWRVGTMMHLWDGATGKAIDPPPRMDGDTDLESIELASSMSPDAIFVASVCKFGTIRLWESSTDAWRTVWQFEEGGKKAAIEFSPDGRRFACGFGNELRVQDVETGEGKMTSMGDTNDDIRRVRFSPDGKNIAVPVWEEEKPYWQVINSDTLEDVLRVTSFPIAFSPDSTHLASREGSDIVVQQMNGTIVQRFTPPTRINALEFLPSTTGVYLATAWEDITVWDMTSTPTPVLRLPCFGYVISMACSRDGKRLVAGYHDGSVRVWDVSINSDNPAQRVVVDSPTPICFSTTPDHALPSSRFLMEHDPIASYQEDEYKTILEQRDTVNVNWGLREQDGWVTSPSRHRLLFWVPPDFRDRLLMPGQQLVLGVEPLELDVSQFVHGSDWAKCYQA
ncbi:hypothetical protein PHLCEN_2v5646 [Hermanssonia centrifuga]|uniref:NACHT domain-containing protein n=1 Tax=Hermanssonia centrifuga TaxID=98765 RepID=A0A2R6P1T8_9APHY|nr:hypothetical protein PHLCEN_2v5646 [Hermanssonia centrifuga]